MKLIISILFFIPFFGISQEYSEVVQVREKSAEQLYASAREWISMTFNSANHVIQMDDPVAGIIVGKGTLQLSESYMTPGVIKIPMTIEWYPNFTIRVAVREERFKYDITDIVIKTHIAGVPSTEQPLSYYQSQSEYFKNGSDPDWLFNNPPEGVKVNKSYAKSAAVANQAYYNLIVKTENSINALIADLKSNMLKQEDDW